MDAPQCGCAVALPSASDSLHQEAGGLVVAVPRDELTFSGLSRRGPVQVLGPCGEPGDRLGGASNAVDHSAKHDILQRNNAEPIDDAGQSRRLEPCRLCHSGRVTASIAGGHFELQECLAGKLHLRLQVQASLGLQPAHTPEVHDTADRDAVRITAAAV